MIIFWPVNTKEGHPGAGDSDRGRRCRARWHAGVPAWNTYERDAYLSLEASLAAGMRHLTWQGRQAAEMEAEAR